MDPRELRRERVFEIAIAQLALLRPELIMNVGDLIDGGTTDRETRSMSPLLGGEAGVTGHGEASSKLRGHAPAGTVRRCTSTSIRKTA